MYSLHNMSLKKSVNKLNQLCYLIALLMFSISVILQLKCIM